MVEKELQRKLTIKPFFKEFSKWYDLPVRKYHTVNHAEAVTLLCMESSNDPTLVLAGLYHDAVYIPGSDVNEKSSALALMHDARTLVQQGYVIDMDIVREAGILIAQTTINHHLTEKRVTDVNLAMLLDFDLCGLAEAYPEFIDNQMNILEENFLDVNDLGKSAQFLKQFLNNRGMIYHTDYCRQNWERQARQNIVQLIRETGV